MVLTAELTSEGKVIVKGENASKLYNEGYGRIFRGILELDDVEATYLAYREIIEVMFKNRILSVPELFNILEKNNPHFPLIFTVYQDLRMRGRIVKPGFKSNTLFLYTKGLKNVADKVVYVIGEETFEFTIKELLEWISETLKLGKEPILAIVDKHGDVTYYEVMKIDLVKKQ